MQFTMAAHASRSVEVPDVDCILRACRSGCHASGRAARRLRASSSRCMPPQNTACTQLRSFLDNEALFEEECAVVRRRNCRTAGADACSVAAPRAADASSDAPAAAVRGWRRVAGGRRLLRWSRRPGASAVVDTFRRLHAPNPATHCTCISVGPGVRQDVTSNASGS
jgi:hypothetical protein